MKKNLRSFLLLMAVWMASVMPVMAHPLPGHFDAQHTADSLWNDLHHTLMSADSLALLNDLFDLVPTSERDSVGMMALDVALRTHNDAIGLDLLRNLANINMRSDTLLQRDMELAQRFPPSADRDHTIAFIRAMLPYCMVRSASQKDIDGEIQRLTRLLASGKDFDIYERLNINHMLAIYISTFSQGELLEKYIDRLGELVEQLPAEDYTLRNHYYIQAAIIYSNAGEIQKAMALDRKLLRNIDELDNGTMGFARRYRNYDLNRYSVYARMLINYQALAPGEFDKIYRATMALYKTNERVRQTADNTKRPQIAYAMYHKDYPKALELLRQAIDIPSNVAIRAKLLRMMLEAAQATDDKDAQLLALTQINRQLQNTLDEHSREKVKELEIQYDLARVRTDMANAELRRQRTVIWIIVGACVLLLLGLALMIRQLLRTRHLAARLADTNDRLEKESETLRQTREDLVAARDHAEAATSFKNDFIRNMRNEVSVPVNAINEYVSLIIDCSDAQLKPYLHQYATVVKLKGEMLTTLVNDVICLSEIDSDRVKVEPRSTQLLPLCQSAVDAIAPRCQKDVTMTLAPGLRDTTVVTDPHRLLQILNQLLLNATKFTTQGTIVLSYVVDEAAHHIQFTVTDTGIGVADKNAERIFERFVKLDPSVPGMGIGLTVARRIAQLLEGTLILDTSYTEAGSRFTLTLPTE